VRHRRMNFSAAYICSSVISVPLMLALFCLSDHIRESRHGGHS
jgi:hypothetical protein